MKHKVERIFPTGAVLPLFILILALYFSSCAGEKNDSVLYDEDTAAGGDIDLEKEALDETDDNDSEAADAENTEEPVECLINGEYPGALVSDAYGIDWIAIPAGCFVMGCAENDSNCLDREKPRHQVRLKAFEITATEITQKQYMAIMGENFSANTLCGESCPVERVNWFNAHDFCAAVGGRLPSEAEWEYAARAGTQNIFYCGDDVSCLDETAWYEANSDGQTHPVGVKEPNAFGLYDMMGNVLEWVEDCVHNTYDSAPDDGGAWVDSDCVMRVLRGGSCFYLDRGLRVSNRMWTFSAFTRSHFAGFRCARDIER